MANNENRPSFDMVPLPDTPDSRLFVELSTRPTLLRRAMHLRWQFGV
jgi:hypothetical protein